MVQTSGLGLCGHSTRWRKDRVSAAALVPDYARDITPESQRQKLEEIRAAQRDLMRPVGRPTKRDRRDWEKYFKD